jgi:hypothetical protein
VQLIASRVPALAAWRREMTIKGVLTDLRNAMSAKDNARLPQPPEFATY